MISLNTVRLAIEASKAEDKVAEFKKLLKNSKEILKKAVMWKYNIIANTKAKNAPTMFMNGAITRLKAEDTLKPLIDNGYIVASIGYIGMYEVIKLLTGESNYNHKELAMELLQEVADLVEELKEETGISLSLYSSPSEGLCDTFCRKDKAKYGDIKDITDKGWYMNSFHVDVREQVNVFEKFEFEKDFHKIASGGTISFAEISHVGVNVEAMYDIIRYIAENIMYAEVNTKSDICYECDFEGEIKLDDDLKWTCPVCGNQNEKRMYVVRRTCGYIGTNFWNEGKTKEIKQRVTHL